MRLSPARFNRLARQAGQDVQWRQAAPCPCVDPNTGSPRYGCPVCRNLGTLWGAPIPAWTALAGMRVAREYAAFGRWESGDVALSIPGDSPLWAAGEHDRVLMLDSSEPFQVVLTRDGTERVSNGVVSQVDRCFWIPEGAAAVVEGAVPTVSATGSPSWAAGATQPDPGQQYTLVGRRHPEFFVMGDLPQDRAHFGGLPLPRRCQVRRFDLFGRVGVAT